MNRGPEIVLQNTCLILLWFGLSQVTLLMSYLDARFQQSKSTSAKDSGSTNPDTEEFLIRACTAAHGKWTKCHTGTKSRLSEYLSIFCALFAVLVKNRWNKVSCVTHLLQQKSLLVPFCQLIGGEGSLDAGPDHYAVILPCSRHLGYV